MSSTRSDQHEDLGTATGATPASPSRVPPRSVGVLRIALGFILGWSFVDKIFGFGVSTAREKSLIGGASPTQGYLSGTEGWFAGLFQAMVGQWWVDVLFLLGMGGGAVALLLGIASRLGTIAVLATMGMLWISSLPLESNPIIDEHLFYCIAAVALWALGADRVLGLGERWRSLPLVRRAPILW